MNKFKVGDAVLFPNVYGEIYSEKYAYRYGCVAAGFITAVEYIEARNSYLYTIGTVSPIDNSKVVYRIVGERRVFDIDDYASCITEVKLLAKEVEE